MKRKVFRLIKRSEYNRAGPSDLIELPSSKGTSLFVPKYTLEVVVASLTNSEFIHLSGPTATGKTSLIETLNLVPDTFCTVCSALGAEVKPLTVFEIEMAVFDAPGELYFRRALRDGTTYDEPSTLVAALLEAARSKDEHYPAIWLKEMGRVHSASVQGGLLNLLSRTEIVLPSGERVDGRQIAWIADSNYQAEGDSMHTLVPLDDALKRRFTVNLTMDHLTPQQESEALSHLAKSQQIEADGELIGAVIRLGQTIRRHRADGTLQSVPPPSIYGYLAMIRMKQSLPHLALSQLASATLLGNANTEDSKLALSVLNEVFGYQADEDDGGRRVGNLI